MTKMKSLSAVLDEDLEGVLAKMGLLEDLEQAKILCSECGIQLTLSNVQFILPLPDGGSQFVCDSVECADSFLSRTQLSE